MAHAELFQSLDMAHGPALKNRFVLASLTNQQCHPDGRVSKEELSWLSMRAEGGFAMVITAAAPVQQVGQGYPGQLGIFADLHIEGLARLADAIHAGGALCAVQLYHGGNRAAPELAGTLVSASDDPRSGARALDLGEVEQLREDFILAAIRADKAGFDGVELHGAHGYILAQFLSPTINRRDDRYGGILENRARLMLEIIDGIRARCRPDFQIGLRLSPERFGMRLAEMRDFSAEILLRQDIDYLDMSLWDVTKEPHEEEFRGRTLLSLFTDLPRGAVRLGAAGKIMSAADAAGLIEAGCDFVKIGRAGILRHDYPERVRRDPLYKSPAQPFSPRELNEEGVSPAFTEYLRTFPGLVDEG